MIQVEPLQVLIEVLIRFRSYTKLLKKKKNNMHIPNIYTDMPNSLFLVIVNRKF